MTDHLLLRLPAPLLRRGRTIFTPLAAFCRFGDFLAGAFTAGADAANFTLSVLPDQSYCGAFRFAMYAFVFSASAWETMGSEMVASAKTCTLGATPAILPQETASSKVQPDRPPQCGASVVYWMA